MNNRARSTPYLDLSITERAKYLYRVISMKRLLELFQTRHNVLVAPEKWDDPFENFILKSDRVSRRGWYGQCWTWQRASDAMWRIYSGDKNGVRMRSTPAKLLESLNRSTQGMAFVGRVRYLPKKPLMRFASNALAPGHLKRASNAARTLLVKRPAFEHEREIRLLFHGAVSHDGLCRYKIDPHELIDQLMLDPRLTPAEAESRKREIWRKTGFKGQLKHSLMYAPPPALR